MSLAGMLLATKSAWPSPASDETILGAEISLTGSSGLHVISSMTPDALENIPLQSIPGSGTRHASSAATTDAGEASMVSVTLWSGPKREGWSRTTT